MNIRVRLHELSVERNAPVNLLNRDINSLAPCDPHPAYPECVGRFTAIAERRTVIGTALSYPRRRFRVRGAPQTQNHRHHRFPYPYRTFDDLLHSAASRK